jgi:branched-chain amino acid transport system ATP-binding protein
MNLRISGLAAGYGQFRVLDKVDLLLRQGEIAALIGPNGAGKSTVLKSVFGLATVYSGSIRFGEREVTSLKTSDLVKSGISYVPQGRQVFSSLTVKENLEMGAFIIRDSSIIKKRMLEVFKMFPILEEKQSDYAFTLSGGQQQMLAMGRALMQKPKLLLLDEPSLGLSPKLMKEIFAKIVEINKGGASVLIVEQNARQAIAVADRTLVLEDGRVALTGGKEISGNPMVKRIYLGGA